MIKGDAKPSQPDERLFSLSSRGSWLGSGLYYFGHGPGELTMIVL